MTTLKSVYDWAGVDDPLIDAMNEQLGELKLIRELAGICVQDMTEAFANAKFAGAGSPPSTPVAIKAVHKTRYLMARNAARLRVGLPVDNVVGGAPTPQVQAPPPTVGPPIAAASDSSGVELGTVWDQASRTHVRLLGNAEVTKLYEVYRTKRGSLPHPDAECTALQLSAMKQILDMGLPPAADFAVFGPHGNRLLRKQHFMAHFIDAEGKLTKRELPGPPDYVAWWVCYKPYRTGLLMHDVADTEHIDNYAEFLKELDSSFQGRLWFLVAMADYRMRSEQFERMRRRLELQHSQLALANQGIADTLAAYDSTRPWNEVFRCAPDETTFWQREVRDKAAKFFNSAHFPKSALASIFMDDGTAQPTMVPTGAGNSVPSPPPPPGVGVVQPFRLSKGQKKKIAGACAAYNSAAGCSDASCQQNHCCTYCGFKNHGEHDCRTKLRKGKKGGKGGKGKGGKR